MRAFISVLGSSMFRTVELHILLDICHSFSVPSDPGTHNKPKLVHTRSKATADIYLDGHITDKFSADHRVQLDLFSKFICYFISARLKRFQAYKLFVLLTDSIVISSP